MYVLRCMPMDCSETTGKKTTTGVITHPMLRMYAFYLKTNIYIYRVEYSAAQTQTLAYIKLPIIMKYMVASERRPPMEDQKSNGLYFV